ncbi:MAG TPA: substrate-binding domain-containing protein, partial [Phycisphaeraceae bacterium]
NLGWLDYDQAQTGRLLAGYLLQRGHRRLATIMRDVWSIGEHLLHDGISEVVAAAGLAANAVRVRSAPPERSAVTELARGLLADSAERPTGFICRTPFQADCVAQVARGLGLVDSIEAVVCNAPHPVEEARYTCVVPEIDAIEQGRIIGTLLKRLRAGDPPEPRSQHVPVRLHQVS